MSNPTGVPRPPTGHRCRRIRPIRSDPVARLPEARPSSPGVGRRPAVVIGASDWLARRLLEQRVVTLSGEVDDEAATAPWPNSGCSTPPATHRSACASRA